MSAFTKISRLAVPFATSTRLRTSIIAFSSFRFYADRLHELRALRDLLADQCSELGGCARARVQPLLRERRFHLRRVDDLSDEPVESHDDVRGCAGTREHADPDGVIESRQSG